MTQKQRAQEILRRLRRSYTERGEFVHWTTPLELLIGTVLSAQCTDKRVNMVTPALFAKYRTAGDYAKANLRTLEKEIHSTGFYKTKARYVKGIGQALVECYGGEVPQSREELLTLPGVAKKTANLIMAKAFHTYTGIAVDTHVHRVAPRLGLTKHTNTDKIAADLEALFPARDYLDVNEYMIMHGRAVCAPRKPRCGECPLKDICPSAKRFLSAQ